MRDRNICKFITVSGESPLEIKNFIFETNGEVMRTVFKLTDNRLLLVTDGTGRISVDSESLEVTKGALLFLFEGEEICARGDDDFAYTYISFSGVRSVELFRRFGITRISRMRVGFEGLIPIFRDSIARASEGNVDLAAESMLLYAFSRLTDENAEGDGIINKVLEITEESFTEGDFSLSSLSLELGYNPKYLSHLFKEKMGVGYTEYLRTLRIKFAVSLFDHGLDSVKNVALLSGFNDPLYFSSVFKKVVGRSPKEYKARENVEPPTSDE